MKKRVKQISGRGIFQPRTKNRISQFIHMRYLRKSGKNSNPKSEIFKIIGEDGEVTIVTKTIVPAGKFPTPEKFRKANEMLEKAIMLPS